MISAVATDLDGTIVRADDSVSAATLAACQALRVRGIPVIAATARSPAGLRALPDLLPHLTLAVCCGGSIGYDPSTVPGIRWRDLLGADDVRALLAFVDEVLPASGVALYDGERWRMTEAYAAIRTSRHNGPTEVVPAGSLGVWPACAMTLCHPTLGPAELIHRLAQSGTALSLASAGTEIVEIAPAGIDKATGVLRALHEVGVPPDRAVAFGDMPIDIPMFAVVGRSVAMAGSPADVLAAASAVTATVAEDGFVTALISMGVLDDDFRKSYGRGAAGVPGRSIPDR